MEKEIANFWLNLGKIQMVLLKTDEEFAKYIGISHKNFLKNKGTAFLPLNIVYECAEKLNFHFADLLEDHFDVGPIFNQLQGNHIAALEKYSSAATYSKTRQTANVLRYLEYTRGERAKINLLRKFQLTDDFIFNSNNSVNIHLFIDVINYVGATHGLTYKDFFEIGRMTPFSSMNKDFQEELIDKKDINELLEFFFSKDISQRFDKNFIYEFKGIAGDYAYIEATPNKMAMEELRLNASDFGNEEVCLTRMGVISSISWFKFKQFMKVEKVASIYSGDSANLYRADISQVKKLSSFQFSSGRSLDAQPIYQ